MLQNVTNRTASHPSKFYETSPIPYYVLQKAQTKLQVRECLAFLYIILTRCRSIVLEVLLLDNNYAICLANAVALVGDSDNKTKLSAYIRQCNHKGLTFCCKINN